ncbi:MAG: cell shape determination protein CcmA [Alphaproteobacteria bacterium]|nr:cell shape determination protein CcmA [Alphaproteobacteria bacterium]
MQDQTAVNPSTVIGPDIKIIGSIEASADLMVEGRIEGDVRCRSLILGENGSIKGKIYCERARVSGTVDGLIDTGDLGIEATGVVMGEASYTRLKVTIGGVVEGNMKSKAAPEQKLKLVAGEAPAQKRIVIE